MSLGPGNRLGPYEIVSALGAGGMGEVYRARDARLGREVAIKVLPAGFTADPERLQRFEQEARAAAALNHPNILAVHDIGTHDSAPYIVSELLDGETLRERLNGGALPVRKAIEHGVKICHGLAAAHEKGIVHRDLKPENIFLTRDGHVKILDFGLAKLTQAEPAFAGSALPTTPPNTLPGVVLGTIGYMSPEQVRGLAADHRSDIFALGTILFEMLAGSRVFRGDTPMDVMTAILKDDPPHLPVPERHIPPALERIVDRCLEKNPGGRFKSADDLAFALEALSMHSGGLPVEVMLPWPRTRERIAWSAAVLFLLVLLGTLPFVVAHLREAPAQGAAVRFSVLPPPDTAFAGGATVDAPDASVSPDGRWLVFRARRLPGPVLLWVRELDSLDAHVLPGTDGGSSPFWSPDSRYIAFFAQRKLKKIEVSGGPVQTLCDAPTAQGGSWNGDGTIIFAATGLAGLSRVSAAGGQPTVVTTLDAARKETSHRWPHFLPDGRHFLFFVQPANVIQIGSLDAQETTTLLSAEARVVYTPPGYLFFTRQGTLMAQAFDAARAELSGEALPIAEQVTVNETTDGAEFSVSQNGVLAYRFRALNDRQLVWLDRDGKPISNFGQRGAFHTLWLASDEKRAVVSQLAAGQRGDLWLIDGERGTASAFTFDATSGHPVWSPDTSRIVFSSGTFGQRNALAVKAATGLQQAELLVQTPTFKQPTDWSLDGRIIVFEEQSSATGWDISVVPLDGDRKPRPVIRTPFNEHLGQLSPDAQLLAYTSTETGREEVYVVNFPDVSRKWQVSTNGGTKPRWRRDEKELFFVDPTGMLMSVPIALDRGLEVGVPRPLFELNAADSDGWNYGVSADGQRILAIRGTEASPTPLTVVVNWTALLKK
jgi:eukaryotic-like serine/threonine-protein kinase